MSCGLSKVELDLLYYLYRHGCLSEKSSKRYEAIVRDLGTKMNVDATLLSLMNKGYVTRKKKDSFNYWAIAGEAKRVLLWHEYRLPSGGRVPL
jgi:hypothetical protein